MGLTPPTHLRSASPRDHRHRQAPGPRDHPARSCPPHHAARGRRFWGGAVPPPRADQGPTRPNSASSAPP
eukprot:13863257-Alexandrium_andersonii.AAC.1